MVIPVRYVVLLRTGEQWDEQLMDGQHRVLNDCYAGSWPKPISLQPFTCTPGYDGAVHAPLYPGV